MSGGAEVDSIPDKVARAQLDRTQREKERRHQVRGLVLLALAAILFAIFRAGIGRVFGPGWWRLW